MVKRGPHGRPQASEGEAQHEPFARLDASVKDTSVCIVDDTGKTVREVKVTSEPDALLAVLKNPAYRFKRTLDSGDARWPTSKPGDRVMASAPGGFAESSYRPFANRYSNKRIRNRGMGADANGRYHDITAQIIADMGGASDGFHHPGLQPTRRQRALQIRRLKASFWTESLYNLQNDTFSQHA